VPLAIRTSQISERPGTFQITYAGDLFCPHEAREQLLYSIFFDIPVAEQGLRLGLGGYVSKEPNKTT
jgi:hypothetical protein